MDAVEFIKEYRRMCKKYAYMEACGEDCSSECPLHGGYCDVGYEHLEADYVVSKVQQWSHDHPQKTIMQDFFEKFPNAPKDDSGSPCLCPADLGYEEKNCGEVDCNCLKCWNRPLEN